MNSYVPNITHTFLVPQRSLLFVLNDWFCIKSLGTNIFLPLNYNWSMVNQTAIVKIYNLLVPLLE